MKRNLTNNFTSLAKNLRKRSTDAEKLLWRLLRSKQIGRLKFRRQQPIGNYIVDFVCFEKQIIIELDGGQHAIEKTRDMKRDKWLEGEGFKVLRFWNNEILKNRNEVLEIIMRSCLISPLPLIPSHKGRGNSIIIYRPKTNS